jgi:sugar phosphate permease
VSNQVINPSRYRWVVLVAALFAQSAFATVLHGLPSIAPVLQLRYGLSLPALGGVLASTSLGMLLTLLAWGALADRFGERWVIACGLIIAALALAAAANLATASGLAVGLALAGMGGASANAASGRAVLGWFDASQRGLALGIRQMALPLGGAFGSLALPQLVLRFGPAAGLLALAGLCLTAAVTSALILRDPPQRALESHQQGPSPMRDPRIWRLAAGSGLLVIVQFSLLTFLVVYLLEQGRVAVTTAAGALAALQLGSAAARVLVGWWSDRWRRRLRPLLLMTLAMAAALGVAAMSAGVLPLAIVMVLLAALLAFSWNGLAFTATAEYAGLIRSGTALGLQNTVLALSGTLAPPAFGAIVANTSWEVGFLALAGCASGSLLLLLPLTRAEQPAGTTAGSIR